MSMVSDERVTYGNQIAREVGPRFGLRSFYYVPHNPATGREDFGVTLQSDLQVGGGDGQYQRARLEALGWMATFRHATSTSPTPLPSTADPHPQLSQVSPLASIAPTPPSQMAPYAKEAYSPTVDGIPPPLNNAAVPPEMSTSTIGLGSSTPPPKPGALPPSMPGNAALPYASQRTPLTSGARSLRAGSLLGDMSLDLDSLTALPHRLRPLPLFTVKSPDDLQHTSTQDPPEYSVECTGTVDAVDFKKSWQTTDVSYSVGEAEVLFVDKTKEIAENVEKVAIANVAKLTKVVNCHGGTADVITLRPPPRASALVAAYGPTIMGYCSPLAAVALTQNKFGMYNGFAYVQTSKQDAKTKKDAALVVDARGALSGKLEAKGKFTRVHSFGAVYCLATSGSTLRNHISAEEAKRNKKLREIQDKIPDILLKGKDGGIVSKILNKFTSGSMNMYSQCGYEVKTNLAGRLASGESNTHINDVHDDNGEELQQRVVNSGFVKIANFVLDQNPLTVSISARGYGETLALGQRVNAYSTFGNMWAFILYMACDRGDDSFAEYKMMVGIDDAILEPEELAQAAKDGTPVPAGLKGLDEFLLRKGKFKADFAKTVARAESASDPKAALAILLAAHPTLAAHIDPDSK